MSSTAFEEHARAAARAARASVAPVAYAVLDRPRRAMTTTERRTMPVARIAAVAVLALLAGTVFLVGGDGGEGSTVLTDGTVPATVTPASPPPVKTPPPPGPHPDLFGESVVAGGTTTDGRAWALHVGGPGNGLCLAVDASRDIGVGGMTSVCEGRAGGPDAPGERHRPLIGGDLRTPTFVFGRMPVGVVAVEVVLDGGTRSDRQPVHRSDEGPVYAVELHPGATPVGVEGFRADNASVRFDVAG